jgi:pyruvate dehydrogenase phosphatase
LADRSLISGAFGDARYKWPPDLVSRLYGRGPRQYYKTPPYVTAEPVVSTVDLTASPPVSEASSPSATSASRPRDRRFIVMATDGLWDELSNEEVVGLVGVWLDGSRGTLSRDSVLSRVTASSEQMHQSHTSREKNQAFVFSDSNLATHLIR